MRASAKSTELNAYVTGFGASKRVVVWDTTIATQPRTRSRSSLRMRWVTMRWPRSVGRGTDVRRAASAVLDWLPLRARAAGRYGAAWGIPAQQDWGALVVILLWPRRSRR